MGTNSKPHSRLRVQSAVGNALNQQESTEACGLMLSIKTNRSSARPAIPHSSVCTPIPFAGLTPDEFCRKVIEAHIAKECKGKLGRWTDWVDRHRQNSVTSPVRGKR